MSHQRRLWLRLTSKNNHPQVGSALEALPATEALKTWPVRLQGGEILVGIGMP